MFAFFNLGPVELVILLVMFAVPAIIAAVVILATRGNKKDRDND